MAMVSHTQAVTTITPPASAHGDRSSWDFAVPISPENATYDHYISNDLAGKTYSPRQPLSGQPNGYPRSSQRRTDTLDSQRSGKSGYADAHLAASRVDAIARKPSGHSEADSLLDMYKNGDKRRAPNGAVANGAEETERNNNYWIHRDKLAQIERHELEEAGFLPRNSGRSTSRSSSQSRASKKRRDTSSSRDGTQHFAGEEAKTRMVSPIPAEDEPDEYRMSNVVTDWRSPEEINAERENYTAKKDPPRPGTSRIPLPKHSAAPIPSEAVEREAPLPRSRSGSQVLGTSPGPEGFRYQRKRGGSVGSQVLLDDASDLGSSNDGDVNSKKNSPKSGSPGKAKMPSNKGPNSGKRTTSKSRTGSQGQNKSRTNSGTTARPRTASRPTTARPEGEAPWIATMYKPDPRLPPDQQMLPTHAKRIAQEQWEKEGKVGNVYDKDFKLLNDHDYSAKRRSTGSMSPVYQDPVPEQPQQEAQPVQQVQSRPVDEEVQREEQPRNNWPLDSSEKVEQNGRPQTAKTEHAGYKTTPTLHTSPTIPNITTTVTAPHSPKPETIRVPDPGEKEDEKPKKSACCCVVM
ncbi:hypothetical protein GTA08_BOTSDO03443 [Neofusicoccum parvum]|uniref:Uncharacterized protein n=1 Tax=Neofusicoccum parvum TaxID=310453 RepID=A0ACB5RXL6_9PEZI|nr:hypothetical protein GTA08_BOTSDO03443 [Neofusicoccum parvum]GME53855.1 hypothetical protein GTA08_BOTSDO03443 [Neofusicoccum parvum]